MNKRILGATGVVLLGCSGLFGPDPARIVALEQALAEAEPETAMELFLQGSVEAGSVRFGCARAFGALPGADPSQRATILAQAFSDWTAWCPAPCAGDLPALALVEPPRRIAAALAQCDAAGPDPVFGGPLAGLRASMPPMDYLAVRALAERAEDASPSFATLHPKLAVSVVLQDTPAEMAPGADLAVSASRQLGPDALADLQSAIRACGPEATLAHRVVLNPQGRVAGTASASREPDGPCLAAALQGLTLPADGEYAVLDLAWKPPPLEPGGGGGGEGGPRRPMVDGPLGLDEVEAIVRAHQGHIRYCYEKQLVRSPSLAGDLVVRFAIATDGSVSDAQTLSNTVGSPALARCIEAAFGKWTFPRVSETVKVTWPIHFAPG